MTQAILNPVDLWSLLPLLPAEVKFASCLAAGKPYEVGNGDLPRIPIIHGNSANVVRPEVIRFFAYGGDADKHPVRGPAIQLQGAWICGKQPLDLTHANIPYALLFGNCHFADSVRMEHAGCAALNLVGSHLAKGLEADGLTTKGSVFLCEGFSAEGEVRLLGANIGGNLECGGGEFHNPDGRALVADGLTAKGSVFLRKGFFAEGEVRMVGANIAGQLSCTGGKFVNQSSETSKPAFVAERIEIRGALGWKNVRGNGVVNLGDAKAGVLADDLDSWEPFKFVLDGFTYGQFAGPTDAKSRVKWLGNRPSQLPSGKPLPFSPLPYEQAAKVLFRMGHARDAREILLEKEREVTKREKWWRRPLRWLWDEFAGYGYRLRRTVGWSLATVVVGCGVFSHASDIGGIVPHQPAILASGEYQQARQGGFAEMESVREKFSEYPEFNPLVFSADVFIPLFALHQEPFWYPVAGSENILAWLAASQHALALAIGGALLALWLFTALEEELRSRPRLAKRWKRLPRQVCSLVLRAVVVLSFYALGLESPRHWYWLEIGAGWILTSLFLLSVTGFLRPRQSSGEKG